MSNKEEIQNQMMDYLFDEMDPAQKKEFEKILESRPDLQSELKKLRETSGLLSSTPFVVPEYKPAFLMISKEPDEITQNRGKHEQAQQGRLLRRGNEDQEGFDDHGKVKNLFNPVMKTFLAIAASVLLIILGSSLTGMEMGQTEEGFYLTLGNPPTQTESGISEEQVLQLVEQIQVEQTVMLTSLLEQAQQQQNDKLNEMIFVLADYYDDRRQQDLLMFADGLEQLEVQTHHRFNRTHAALGDLINAISNP